MYVLLALGIGQTKPVVVFRMIAAGGVEEKMYERQIFKDGIRRTVFTEAKSVQRYFNRHELRKLFELADAGVCDVMVKVHDIKTDWSKYSFLLEHTGVVGLSRHEGFYDPADIQEEPESCESDQDSQNSLIRKTKRVLHPITNSPFELSRTQMQHTDIKVSASTIDKIQVGTSSIGKGGASSRFLPDVYEKRTNDTIEIDPSSGPPESYIQPVQSDAKVARAIQIDMLSGLPDRCDKPVRSDSNLMDIVEIDLSSGDSTINSDDFVETSEVELIDNTENRTLGDTSSHKVLEQNELSEGLQAASRLEPKSALKVLLNLLERAPEDIDNDLSRELHRRIALLSHSLGLLSPPQA
jgi:hypothetical protein